jgi:plasmid stabilization system protein ParE
MKVFFSELAESKLLKLSDYLLENWNLKTRDKFIEKLSEEIHRFLYSHKVVPNRLNLEAYINVL